MPFLQNGKKSMDFKKHRTEQHCSAIYYKSASSQICPFCGLSHSVCPSHISQMPQTLCRDISHIVSFSAWISSQPDFVMGDFLRNVVMVKQQQQQLVCGEREREEKRRGSTSGCCL